jgi:hypothetical protein
MYRSKYCRYFKNHSWTLSLSLSLSLSGSIYERAGIFQHSSNHLRRIILGHVRAAWLIMSPVPTVWCFFTSNLRAGLKAKIVK